MGKVPISEPNTVFSGLPNTEAFNSRVAYIRPEKLKANSASLNEDGYKRIAKLKDDREMALFITRVAEMLGYKIRDDSMLSGVAPYYSGKKATQSLKALKQEMKRAAGMKK